MAVNKIAVIFDFDDTLTDDSTSELLKKYDLDPNVFWGKKVSRLVSKKGWEPALAYLHLLLKHIEQKKLPPLTNQDLQDFGTTLKPYPGLRGLLTDLRRIAMKELCEIKFYIVSGGLQDIIDGFPLRGEFEAVWGSQLAPRTSCGPVTYVKRAITFTEKTRYLFVINKGLSYKDVEKNPYLVNEEVDSRPVPFGNMIYIGDGITDIPCFSLIGKWPSGERGKTFGVFKPGNEKSAKTAWLDLLAPKRVGSVHAPKYRNQDELGSLLRMVVQTRCADIKLRKEESLRPTS